MKYSEQIKHPDWQRKRNHIFTRDEFTCRCCGETEQQLSVHHLYYLPNTKIWEYDNEALVTVCNTCHEKLTNELPKLAGIIAFKILAGNLDPLKKQLLNLSL
jgi:5-methylcytosine-specific restriction endonuclease McrA